MIIKKNIGDFDVCLFDPPFNIWKNIDYIPKAKTYVCFTNFQNRHYVDKIFGVPKFEMIWHFKDGRWGQEEVQIRRCETVKGKSYRLGEILYGHGKHDLSEKNVKYQFR